MDIKLDCSNGKSYDLNDLKGHYTVLYFYPKDNTPGCTMEAIDFSRLKEEFDKIGVVVIGVSKDSSTSHDKFIEKHDITIPLLSDPDKLLHEKFGTIGEKNMFGKKVMGTIRTTFILDKEANVIKTYPKVKVKGHADQVLEDIKAIIEDGK
ncbi:MAG: peroxiredoxin [Tissierellia bacterium]|nr:peroxiredoxin [Tissierellia bacterium]